MVATALLAALAVATGPSAGAPSAASAPATLEVSTVAATAAAELPRPGTVLRSESLRRDLWIPGSTSRAFRLTYVTKDSHERRARSTGTVFVPHGQPPRGGWPVVSWAHGISGLGDSCAPSKVGPVLKERDWSYLRTWMEQGYAVVASDYVGLGTPDLMPYLHGKAQAHSVVDMVKAGRSFTAGKARRLRLSDEWVTIGQSQGGGASVYTARYATAYGGKRLDFRGAVGTGTPAYIEDYVKLLGPQDPPLTADLNAYLVYIVASLRDVHPELGIDEILTDAGKHYVGLAEVQCDEEFAETMDGVLISTLFEAPMATLPGLDETLADYMAMPESGFDTPVFMAHGAADVDVPYAQTARYAARLAANDEPVTFRTYPSDHSGTMQASLEDTVPFVRRQFRR
ncbi:prolyl oligopeptidase family serine peptidase [Nocardioides sp. HDW12B]|nr:prolyl oligopeptidase family serine peptidase [Nocardioides sp. HDW12B]